jgi:hypothetical protein
MIDHQEQIKKIQGIEESPAKIISLTYDVRPNVVMLSPKADHMEEHVAKMKEIQR